jgi:hypothetical protein
MGHPAGTKLFVCDHFSEVRDVLIDAGDLLRPGNQALVRDSGSVLAFGFGKHFECVLQLLLKRGTGHRGRVSLEQPDPASPADAAYADGLTNEGVKAVLRLLRRDKSELPNQALAITKTVPSKTSCGRDKRKGFHSKRRMRMATGKERSDTCSFMSSTR